MKPTILAGLVRTCAVAQAQTGGLQPVAVTVDNFIRAETDLYLGGVVKEAGGTGRFGHRREVASIDDPG
jgi:hypothetical protein